MKKNKMLGCISLLMFSPVIMAMQPLDDQNLSETTGQTGINIGINVNKIQMDQVSIIDRDGLSALPTANDANAASLVFAGSDPSTVANQSFNISFTGAQANKSVMNFVIDTDGGAGKPFANIGIGFDSSVTGIKLSPFALYLASATASSSPTAMKSIFTGTSKNAGVIKVLKMDGLDINFASTKPIINLQIGNAPQGHMFAFDGAIQSICGTDLGCTISLLSDDSDIGANFKFQFKGTDTVNGFSLKGFYAGVEPSGFVFGNSGDSSKFNLGINNVTMGTSGAVNSTNSGAFQNIQNGSMGNFGAIGTSVTDLKVKISGL